MIRILVISPAKKGFKSIISIFCCSVSVENISLHFQTFNLPLIVMMIFLHKESDNSQYSRQRSDLIIISLSEWHEETEQTETDQIQKNCGNISEMLQETYLQE